MITRESLLKKSLIVISSLAVLAIGYFSVTPYIMKIFYSGDLPDLPNFNSYSESVVKYLEQLNDAAALKPYEDGIVGKLGMAYQANFFYEEAEKCYDAAININDSEWEWYYFRALIKEELGETKSTINDLKKVTEINPDIPYAWFRLANSYFKQNSFDAAESAFVKASLPTEFVYSTTSVDEGAFPLPAYANYNLGRLYLSTNKIENAESLINELLDKYPGFGPAYRLLGQIYTAQGNAGKGEDYAIRAGDYDSYIPPADPMFNELTLKSRNTDFILKQVDLARRSENFKWAEELCQHILNYNPDDIEAVTKYILMKLETSDYTELDDKLKTYYEYYKDDDDKLRHMAETLYRWNHKQLAQKFLERALSVNSSNADAHVLYIRLLAAGKISNRALEYCKKAVELIKDNSDLRTEYGRILALKGKEKEAAQQFNTALKINPDNEITHILLGVIAQQKGDVNNALYHYRQSVKINPLNVNTIVKLGNYLTALKRWNEAQNVFINALHDFPNSVELIERYSYLLTSCPDAKIRDESKALELAKRISLVRKSSPDQEIQSAITLSLAYAGTGEFNTAINVMINVIERAKRFRLESYIPKMNSYIELFEQGKPYRL